jgi:flagellar protein FliS
MNNPSALVSLRQYGKVGVQTEVESASPHRLIQMLMEGALARMVAAKGHMARGETAAKGERLGWAISIVEGLRVSLDHEAGGEVAANLDRLYEYIGRRLVEANLRNDPEIIDEVRGLLLRIKEGWDGIPEALRGGAQGDRRAAVQE